MNYSGMQKFPSTNDDYINFVKYKYSDYLKNVVYEILRELENEAGAKNCFTGGNTRCDKYGYSIVTHTQSNLCVTIE